MSKPRGSGLQLDLFHPVPTRPHWRNLPSDVRSRVLELLTQLMRESGQPRHGSQIVVTADHGQEAGHE